jgi:hypothetical protein
MITTRLRDACRLMDIRLINHIVVSGDRAISFAELRNALTPRRLITLGRKPGPM